VLLDQESLRFIFGLKLRSLRQEKELSLKELSQRSHLSPSYINEIEKGKKYPKTEKIIVLANSLGVSYDELISLQLKNELGLLSSFLKGNVLKGLPLDVFGIPARAIFELMAEHPQKFSGLLGALLDLIRQYNVKVEDFFYAALRAQIDMHGNYFQEIEEAVEAFRKEAGWEAGGSPKELASRLKKLLESRYRKEILEEDFSALAPELSGLFFFFDPANDRRFHLNRKLSEREKVFMLAKEVGFAQMRLKERFPYSQAAKFDSYEPVYNNFAASYFASALLIPRKAFVAEVEDFLARPKWDGQAFLRWVKKYPGTLESFFHRLSQVLPHFFGLENLFLLRYDHDVRQGSFDLSRELHLSELHAPHRKSQKSHHCRRWISTKLLMKAREGRNAEQVGAQRSNYFAQKLEYLCLSVAHAKELEEGQFTCTTIGLLINERTRRKVKFLECNSIPAFKVADSCEKCALTDCKERAAPRGVDFEETRARTKEAIQRVLALR
jgi:XRE family transcriptional regulator, fatty acid utilization regulator